MKYKDYVASTLKGKRVKMVCECFTGTGAEGVVKDYYMSGSEIVYMIDTGRRIVNIGENTPNLEVEILK